MRETVTSSDSIERKEKRRKKKEERKEKRKEKEEERIIEGKKRKKKRAKEKKQTALSEEIEEESFLLNFWGFFKSTVSAKRFKHRFGTYICQVSICCIFPPSFYSGLPNLWLVEYVVLQLLKIP